MARRVMLLDLDNQVVAELTSKIGLRAIDSGEISLIRWRSTHYIYDRNRDNGEYLFFCEVGATLRVTDASLKVRES